MDSAQEKMLADYQILTRTQAERLEQQEEHLAQAEFLIRLQGATIQAANVAMVEARQIMDFLQRDGFRKATAICLN